MRILVVQVPNQGLESSFCHWTAGHGLLQKERFVHRHRYDVLSLFVCVVDADVNAKCCMSDSQIALEGLRIDRRSWTKILELRIHVQIECGLSRDRMVTSWRSWSDRIEAEQTLDYESPNLHRQR